MKRLLITGANSYIGESVRDFLLKEPGNYEVEIKDTIGWVPSTIDFVGYDVVFNVAGIAHIKETRKNRHLFYDVNRDLCIQIAKNAKAAGVKQFILLSSMSVYGKETGIIKKSTKPTPNTSYGKSKLQADDAIKKIEDDSFKFSCLRPPMVYGKGCKGNYQKLRQFALKSPVFPDYENERSMIYIENLCVFIKTIIDSEKSGLFFPQNKETVNTSRMVKTIASVHDKKITCTKIFNPAIRLFRISIIKKVFGNLIYEPVDRVGAYSFNESIKLTEQ